MSANHSSFSSKPHWNQIFPREAALPPKVLSPPPTSQQPLKATASLELYLPEWSIPPAGTGLKDNSGHYPLLLSLSTPEPSRVHIHEMSKGAQSSLHSLFWKL